ncbi:hypothetical protein ACS0TY_027022 [Phlomoides rotata]
MSQQLKTISKEQFQLIYKVAQFYFRFQIERRSCSRNDTEFPQFNKRATYSCFLIKGYCLYSVILFKSRAKTFIKLLDDKSSILF